MEVLNVEMYHPGDQQNERSASSALSLSITARACAASGPLHDMSIECCEMCFVGLQRFKRATAALGRN